MRLSKRRMAAPSARIRAPARGDQRYGTRAVVFTPRVEVAAKIDPLAIRPRQGVKVLDLSCSGGLGTGQQLFEGSLALTRDDVIRSRSAILGLVVRRLGAT